MMKVALLSLIIAGCSALKFKTAPDQVVERGPNKHDQDGITYSRKAKHQDISNKIYKREDYVKINEESSTGPMKDVGPIEEYLDMWFVNLRKATDRRQCMDGQIKAMNMKGHVYKALEFLPCSNKTGTDPNLETCLKGNGFGDCVKKGIHSQGLATHGTQGSDDMAQAYHIVSNTCSHKRALDNMLKQHKEQNSKAKYAILMEDDVILNNKDFLRKVVNFAETYNGKYGQNWTMVQIDPFGSKCDRHIVGYFEGLPVWKPINVNMNSAEAATWECSNYWGAQALLVKYDSIKDIISHMEKNPTVPLDWLPAELPNGLAWHANIAKNPEMEWQNYAGRLHHKNVNLPDFCKASVKGSTIAAHTNVANTTGAQ